MTYATLRFVHLGWRVIKVEPTPVEGRKSKGDPNRYIGRPVAGEDRHSYFVAPNVGKEAIAIDLKQAEGQALLKRLIPAKLDRSGCLGTYLRRGRTVRVKLTITRTGRVKLVGPTGRFARCLLTALAPMLSRMAQSGMWISSGRDMVIKLKLRWK